MKMANLLNGRSGNMINLITQLSLKMALKFRTVISEITIGNYTGEESGERLELRLSRKGRVVLSFDFGKTTQIIETAKEEYHDGQWHSAEFEVDNKPTSDNEYIIRFVVDGKTQLSKMSSSFKFDGHINVGFGFTGCMRDILINDQDIYKLQRSEEKPNDYFKVSDIGVVHNFCSLKDYCNPNPCQNGGKCNQTEDNVVCDCRTTLYEGSTCHRRK